jgi:hypothetical protein
VAVASVLALAAGVTAAYGALGAHDTTTGTGALAAESTGDQNVADGYNALNANTSGQDNTAVGYKALSAVTTANGNTAVGSNALPVNQAGGNAAVGFQSLHSNTTGGQNTASGAGALYSNTTGVFNAAVGASAGEGPFPNTTGSDNTFLGAGAEPDSIFALNDATALGAGSTIGESDAVSLGDATANVGIGNDAPASRLQIGLGSTDTFGDYLQIPVVQSTAKTPPAADCNNTTKVGRLVLVEGKKTTLFACVGTGVWAKV